MANDPALLRLVKMQLVASKAALRAAHASLEAFEELISIQIGEEPAPPPARRPTPTPEEPESNGDVVLTETQCSHPVSRRTRAEVMGYPNRFICQDCGYDSKEGEVK